MGPITEPWGTPYSMGNVFDVSVNIVTDLVLFAKYVSNHKRAV
jgi:hypothetical protein